MVMVRSSWAMTNGAGGADRGTIRAYWLHGGMTMMIAKVVVFGILVAAPMCGYWKAMVRLSDLREESYGEPGGFAGDRLEKAG